MPKDRLIESENFKICKDLYGKRFKINRTEWYSSCVKVAGRYFAERRTQNDSEFSVRKLGSI